tara:strand:+ start:193 stop:786 length:594 start_codon:yes stop_codon:yes gene_type:complete
MSRKNYFLTGLFSIIPIAITFTIIRWLFQFFSKPGKKIIDTILPSAESVVIENIIGFVLTFLFIYFMGLIISNVLGRRLYSFFEKLLSKIPLVSYIYNTIKQITETLSVSQKQAFKKVIYIEYPKDDIWTIALVTGESKSKNGDDYYQVFVPTTPNPTSGFMLYLKKNDIRETNMSVDEGLKIIISGGMLAPKTNEI